MFQFLKIHGWLTVILCISFRSLAEDAAPPKFDDYKITLDAKKQAAAPVLRSVKDRRAAETLRMIYNEIRRPDFAGHYIVAEIPCGTDCLRGAMIDTRTGFVTWFPFNDIEPADPNFWEHIIYCRNSTLIVFQGMINEGKNGRWYYDFSEGKFLLVKHESLPDDSSASSGPEPAWLSDHDIDPSRCDPGMGPP